MPHPVEVTCPACGAVVEAESAEELVTRAREHTLDAHAYDIPPEHVLRSAVPAGVEPAAPGCGAVLDADNAHDYNDHYKQ